MGGDHGPSITLPACQAFLRAHPQAELVLVGTTEALSPAHGWARCTTVVASEVVTMDDPIEVALRRKKDSSMRVAISQVKAADESAAPRAHACVSAGNTGALMAVARYVLKTLEGIDRPAIATVMPNQKDGYTTVLDLGANVDCTAEHLLQLRSRIRRHQTWDVGGVEGSGDLGVQVDPVDHDQDRGIGQGCHCSQLERSEDHEQ